MYVTVYVKTKDYVAEKLSPVLLDIARYVEPVESERLRVLLGHGISTVANLLGILRTLCTTTYTYIHVCTHHMKLVSLTGYNTKGYKANNTWMRGGEANNTYSIYIVYSYPIGERA